MGVPLYVMARSQQQPHERNPVGGQSNPPAEQTYRVPPTQMAIRCQDGNRHSPKEQRGHGAIERLREVGNGWLDKVKCSAEANQAEATHPAIKLPCCSVCIAHAS